MAYTDRILSRAGVRARRERSPILCAGGTSLETCSCGKLLCSTVRPSVGAVTQTSDRRTRHTAASASVKAARAAIEGLSLLRVQHACNGLVVSAARFWLVPLSTWSRTLRRVCLRALALPVLRYLTLCYTCTVCDRRRWIHVLWIFQISSHARLSRSVCFERGLTCARSASICVHCGNRSRKSLRTHSTPSSTHASSSTYVSTCMRCIVESPRGSDSIYVQTDSDGQGYQVAPVRVARPSGPPQAQKIGKTPVYIAI